jgi:hypothetical protein
MATTFSPKGFSWVKSLGGKKKRNKRKTGASKKSPATKSGGKGSAWKAYVGAGKKR